MAPQRKLAGFTLIELLIVVLIIAILAAIAVPNFLEFQVRAKVARVKSDMRTLATALEGYYVDNNAYPTGVNGVGGFSSLSWPVSLVVERHDFGKIACVGVAGGGIVVQDGR